MNSGMGLEQGRTLPMRLAGKPIRFHQTAVPTFVIVLLRTSSHLLIDPSSCRHPDFVSNRDLRLIPSRSSICRERRRWPNRCLHFSRTSNPPGPDPMCRSLLLYLGWSPTRSTGWDRTPTRGPIWLQLHIPPIQFSWLSFLQDSDAPQ